MGKETGIDLDALSDRMWEELDKSKKERSGDRRWTGLDELLNGLMYHPSGPEPQPRRAKKPEQKQPIKKLQSR